MIDALKIVGTDYASKKLVLPLVDYAYVKARRHMNIQYTLGIRLTRTRTSLDPPRLY
jgi:hypothetical protein